MNKSTLENILLHNDQNYEMSPLTYVYFITSAGTFRSSLPKGEDFNTEYLVLHDVLHIFHASSGMSPVEKTRTYPFIIIHYESVMGITFQEQKWGLI